MFITNTEALADELEKSWVFNEFGLQMAFMNSGNYGAWNEISHKINKGGSVFINNPQGLANEIRGMSCMNDFDLKQACGVTGNYDLLKTLNLK